jgi:hypothetical protein
MCVTGIGRRSAWSETQVVLGMFWENLPERHFEVSPSRVSLTPGRVVERDELLTGFRSERELRDTS